MICNLLTVITPTWAWLLQWLERLVCSKNIAGSNTGWEWIFPPAVALVPIPLPKNPLS